MALRELRVSRPLRFDALLLVLGLALFAANGCWVKPMLAGQTGAVAVFFGGYADDLLGGFAFIAYTNILFDLVKPRYRLTRLPVVAAYILACGCFWEFAAPLLVKPSVSDPLDLAAYAVGAGAYWMLDRWRRGRGAGRDGAAGSGGPNATAGPAYSDRPSR